MGGVPHFMYCTYICAVAHKHVHFFLHIIFICPIDTQPTTIMIIDNSLFIQLFLISLLNKVRVKSNLTFWHGY